jgi:hypothetical protein
VEFVPIDIVGVDASHVGEPRHYGTGGGSGLYSVPIRLSRSVDYDEVAVLADLWDNVPQATGRHRPGTTRIFGDTFTLVETTIDEIASHHGRTLRVVIDAFNTEMPLIRAKVAAEEQQAVEDAANHRHHVADVAARLSFE